MCAENEEYETNNNKENGKMGNDDSTTEKIILNDTKFYILAGLFVCVVIELIVIILMKVKKLQLE